MKQYEKISTLAKNEQFTDLSYANQLIASLCDQLIEKQAMVINLQEEIDRKPIVYPHFCYVVVSRSGQTPVLFKDKYEAEIFRLSMDSPLDYLVKSLELNHHHKLALMKKNYQFLGH